MSNVMRKPDFCLCKNKGADQLCSNCTADQRLCFLYSDSTILILFKSKISSFYPISETVEVGNPKVRFFYVAAYMKWLYYLGVPHSHIGTIPGAGS